MEYDLKTACIIAKDIIEKTKNFYVPNNVLDDVPFNFYLKDPIALLEFAKKSVTEGELGNPKAKVRYIEHNKLDLNIVGGYFEFPLEKPTDFLIVVNARHNRCWRRFALLKELCSLYVNHYAREAGHHLALKTYDDYNNSITDSYNQKKKYEEGNLDLTDLDSDTFAILLATELMIPPKFRSYTDALIKRLGDEELTMNDIAKSLLIPEYILSKHISHGYYQESSSIYCQLSSTQSVTTI